MGTLPRTARRATRRTTARAPRPLVHLLLALVAVVAAGCSGATGLSSRLQEQRLAAARARWESRKPPAYRFEVRYSECECVPEFAEWRVVEVRDGMVASVRRLDGSEYTRTWGAPTVEDLFARVEEALATPTRPRTVEVAYDPRRGFPTEILVDLPELPDARVRITVRNFAALDATPP